MDRALFNLIFSTETRSALVERRPLPVSTQAFGKHAGPPIVIVKALQSDDDFGAAACYPEDIIGYIDGTGETQILIEIADTMFGSSTEEQRHTSFSDLCHTISPRLGVLADKLISALLEIDPALSLHQTPNGRWINEGVNFTTLKAQPRKINIQFTLYGNPDDFSHAGFLKKDQNSYSRGWIANEDDLKLYIQFASESFAKRAGR